MDDGKRVPHGVVVCGESGVLLGDEPLVGRHTCFDDELQLVELARDDGYDFGDCYVNNHCFLLVLNQLVLSPIFRLIDKFSLFAPS